MVHKQRGALISTCGNQHAGKPLVCAEHTGPQRIDPTRKINDLWAAEVSCPISFKEVNSISSLRCHNQIQIVTSYEFARHYKVRLDWNIRYVCIWQIGLWEPSLPNSKPGFVTLGSKCIQVSMMQSNRATAWSGISDHKILNSIAVEITVDHRERLWLGTGEVSTGGSKQILDPSSWYVVDLETLWLRQPDALRSRAL